MCWGPGISLGLAVAGTSYVAVGIKKKYPKEIIYTTGFFSIMEAVQAVSYLHIDQCSSQINQVLMISSYLLLIFQPMVLNFLCLRFIPKKISSKISTEVYALSLISIFLMTLKLYPFSWAPPVCNFEPLCSEKLCVSSGVMHLMWEVPMNSYFSLVLPYIFALLVLPLLYGAWKFVLFFYFIPPLILFMFNQDLNELPAIWCITSVPLSLGVHFFDDKLRVDNWPLWRLLQNK